MQDPKDPKDLALASMHGLRAAAEAMMVAYFCDGFTATYHFNSAIAQLHKAAAALGYSLAPLPPAPEPAPATAEALFEVAA